MSILDRSTAQNPKSSLKKKLSYFEEVYSTLEEDIKYLSIPNQCTILQDVAIIAKRALKFDIAIELYKRSIKLEPKNPMLYYNLGKVLYLNGQYIKSAKSYFMALKMGLDIETNQGSVFRHLGHTYLDSMALLKTNLPDDYLKYNNKYKKTLTGQLEFKDLKHNDDELTCRRMGIKMYLDRLDNLFFFEDEIEENKEKIDELTKNKKNFIIFHEHK